MLTLSAGKRMQILPSVNMSPDRTFVMHVIGKLLVPKRAGSNEEKAYCILSFSAK